MCIFNIINNKSRTSTYRTLINNLFKFVIKKKRVFTFLYTFNFIDLILRTTTNYKLII